MFLSLSHLFIIDWLKPEIVTGQYNSCAGISNVIFPGGHASEARIDKIAKNIVSPLKNDRP
jgi:hypothetical protein